MCLGGVKESGKGVVAQHLGCLLSGDAVVSDIR